MGVSILIPTYFGDGMVLNCVASVLKNVANPKIIVYKNDEGFVKACNKLMRSVPEDDVILLNDDTIVLTDIVREMYDLAMSDPYIGIVGAKALAPDGETIINYGVYVGVDGNTAHKHFGKPKNSVKVETQKAVEGSCMYIKREVLDAIGYFDENYGMGYREEIDLCLRAREWGFSIVSCPTAEYIHLTSQTNAKLGIHNDTFDYFYNKWGEKLQQGKV